MDPTYVLMLALWMRNFLILLHLIHDCLLVSGLGPELVAGIALFNAEVLLLHGNGQKSLFLFLLQSKLSALAYDPWHPAPLVELYPDTVICKTASYSRFTCRNFYS